MTLYSAPPGRLFQVDIDGSAGFFINTASTIAALTTAQMQRLVSEAGATLTNVTGEWANGTSYWGYIFPELRSISGYFYDIELQTGVPISVGTFQYSSNTTTGLDGTWTTLETMTGGHGPTGNSTGTGAFLNAKPSYRTIRGITIPSCKAIRVSASGGNTGHRYLGALHIYGDIVSGQTPDRLRLWHPTLDQELTGAYFDFGDPQRTLTATKLFRVKNNSSSLTANSILVDFTALTDTTPTVLGVLAVDNNGGGYASSQNIGNLAAGVISNVLTARLIPSSTAQLSLWRQRIRAAASTWT